MTGSSQRAGRPFGGAVSGAGLVHTSSEKGGRTNDEGAAHAEEAADLELFGQVAGSDVRPPAAMAGSSFRHLLK